MNKTIAQLLAGNADNHMLPFFWQHGEDEATLRKYMDVIHKANCFAVCVESRPHPDFAGPKWWHDMDIILDEARKRNMKVWILDDSHFPTGYANGALKNLPERLGRHNIYMVRRELEAEAGRISLELCVADLLKTYQEQFHNPARVFHDDRILFVTACNGAGETVDLTDCVVGETFTWDKPAGQWTLQICVCSGNTGGRRDNISSVDRDSVRVLIDAVYEPHWQHYSADFGKTIAGFFSDEPELGNGKTYGHRNLLGTDQDLPWSDEVEAAVAEALGEQWHTKLPLLWEDGPDAPQVRSIYMDIVTKLVRKDFSFQLGDWCQAHGVEYIGHIIEDEGQHCRTGSSMGHYFRCLQGQHMSGIDNIGGQVLPQGEDYTGSYFRGDSVRAAEFYHYALAKLAQSAAAIEPRKNGNAMCEIFGNYGWVEGLRMEKYMADHFLVRGVNQFVPHAFDPKTFPDTDCPPHFYANGHDPQIRHFGQICGYMNRVATLTSSGKHTVPVAVLYHGESEWADNNTMPFEKPLRKLYDCQIDCHVIPADVFVEEEYYRTRIGDSLVVNEQVYHAIVIPETNVLPVAAVKGLQELAKHGFPIYFVNKVPSLVAETGEALPEIAHSVVALDELADAVSKLELAIPVVDPPSNRIRVLHINGDTPAFFIVNEAAETFEGTVTLPVDGACYLYDPWYNVCRAADASTVSAGTQVRLTLEPLKTVAVVFGTCDAPLAEPVVCVGEAEELTQWSRKLCAGIEYPTFAEAAAVTIPEDIALDLPEFSGFARYETEICATGNETVVLEITDAGEGVEVFVNDRSLGIQIAPPFRYDLTEYLKEGKNGLVIEVATTLERQAYVMAEELIRQIHKAPVCKTGLTGTVRLYRQAK